MDKILVEAVEQVKRRILHGMGMALEDSVAEAQARAGVLGGLGGRAEVFGEGVEMVVERSVGEYLDWEGLKRRL